MRAAALLALLLTGCAGPPPVAHRVGAIVDNPPLQPLEQCVAQPQLSWCRATCATHPFLAWCAR